MPRRPLLRRTALIASAATLVLGLAACGSDAPDKAADDDRLTIYSGRSEALVAPIYAAFTEATGIELDVRYGESSELAAQLVEEGDRSPADVYFAQDAGALGAVAAEGLFGDLPEDAVEGIPADYRDPEGQWTGVTGRARVIAYDGEQVEADEVPTSVFELTEPEYKGQVAIAPTNASFQSFITAMRLSEGEDVARQWLEDMIANDAQEYEKNGLILDAVDSGQVRFGLINHYYWYEKADEVGVDDMRAQLAYTEKGDPGSLVNIAGIGVLASSIDDPDALEFVRFLLSEEIQERFVAETSEYALVPGVAQVEGARPLDELAGPDIALADLAALPETLELLQEVGLT